MEDVIHIPMFPLSILPLPGEWVPLHIFEPRYRQLLEDASAEDVSFGIYLSHHMNLARIGSLVRLESVLKQYPGGESDIIVRCLDTFETDKLQRTFDSNKLYPGGYVRYHHIDTARQPSTILYDLFTLYMQRRNITRQVAPFSIYHIAQELSLDLRDRYKFLQLAESRQETFLQNRIRYQEQLLEEEEKSKDFYHLN
ncbi:LON peptidase substrate-binding domain-containing protein [Parachryseolinea silvisoli]|jgi:hypothetical protein|uniref:LON peptidase substrate-binding domain-containing protein n=1 Tax=Parachryseolinea silvisoli TaxID=2873601 RepID=UPI002265ECCF|nr:LON peptidase substrate-binding domain-containing protein [Parachryseolinea silvisoli]MCD9018527.1 LON peptidase substrate-binding domain-containing protein [Parachryseolinea silvisoli]